MDLTNLMIILIKYFAYLLHGSIGPPILEPVS